MTPRWQRREFLRLALIQLGAWPLVSTLGCDGGDSGKPEKSTHHDAGSTPDPTVEISRALRERITNLRAGAMLSAYFGHGEAANIEHIGARYLSQVAPDHSDAQILDALEPTIRRIELYASDDAAVDALRNAITVEFEGFDVVDLDGWTLAPTEAALCALLWIADTLMPAGEGDAQTAGDEDAGA
jgi:hypothetical protein